MFKYTVIAHMLWHGSDCWVIGTDISEILTNAVEDRQVID